MPMQWTEQGGRGLPVVSIILESMVMVLDCPCLALEAQLIQNLLNKPPTKFGKQDTSPPIGVDFDRFVMYLGNSGDHL